MIILNFIFWIWWKWENHTYGGLNFKNAEEFQQFKLAEWRQRDTFKYPK